MLDRTPAMPTATSVSTSVNPRCLGRAREAAAAANGGAGSNVGRGTSEVIEGAPRKSRSAGAPAGEAARRARANAAHDVDDVVDGATVHVDQAQRAGRRRGAVQRIEDDGSDVGGDRDAFGADQ